MDQKTGAKTQTLKGQDKKSTGESPDPPQRLRPRWEGWQHIGNNE